MNAQVKQDSEICVRGARSGGKTAHRCCFNHIEVYACLSCIDLQRRGRTTFTFCRVFVRHIKCIFMLFLFGVGVIVVGMALLLRY